MSAFFKYSALRPMPALKFDNRSVSIYGLKSGVRENPVRRQPDLASFQFELFMEDALWRRTMKFLYLLWLAW